MTPSGYTTNCNIVLECNELLVPGLRWHADQKGSIWEALVGEGRGGEDASHFTNGVIEILNDVALKRQLFFRNT